MEIPTAEELISVARRSVGPGADDHDLATALRQKYGLRTTQSSISRWRGSPRGPSYEATVALLDIAGWLNSSRLAAGAAEAEEAVRGEEEAVRREAESRSRARRARKSA